MKIEREDTNDSNRAQLNGDRHPTTILKLFERRLCVCLLLTLPVFYLSPVFETWFGYRAIQFSGVNWMTPIFATIICIYGGGIFLKGCWDEFPDDIQIVTPISFALIAAFGSSLDVSFGEGGNSFYIEFFISDLSHLCCCSKRNCL